MAPLPKRRHSTRRQSKRERVNQKATLAEVGLCPKCGNTKQSHRVCKKCGFYK